MNRLRRLMERVSASVTPNGIDIVLAVVLAAASAVLAVADLADPRPWGGTVVAGLVVCAALAWRRRCPVGANAAAIAAIVAVDLLGLALHGPDGSNRISFTTSCAVVILIYSGVRYAEGRRRIIVWAAWMAMTVVDVVATEPGLPYGPIIGSWVGSTSVAALGLAFAYRADLRVERAAQARAGEREQLARELHDVVAHHVSAMVVQASAALAVLERQPEQARPSLQLIKASGQEAMGEMRQMVGILRGTEVTERTSHQGIDGLADLFGEHPGPIPVHLRTVGTPVAVSGALDQSVHRIAQESVTNARRHGCEATAIDVLVRWAPDELVLEVANDGARAPEPGSTDANFGLAGMAERTRLLGGTFAAGPRPDGGWRVVAHVPLDADAGEPSPTDEDRP